MKHVQLSGSSGACILAAIALSSVAAHSADDFYKGKQIEFIIGQSAGGTYDQWARAISRHMGKHIPGNPIFVPKNMPGGGHIKATNYLYSVAPKDGTSIGIFSRNIPMQALLKHPAIKFTPNAFNWIGSPELTNRICVAKTGVPVQRGQDLFEHELVVGGEGPGSAISTTPRVLNGVLGMKFKLIEGYNGSPAIMLAIQRGELQGLCQTVAGLDQLQPGWFEKKEFVVLFNLEKKPIPQYGAPTIYEFAKVEEQRQVIGFYSSSTELGRPIAAPPGVPKERVDVLRRAFDATMSDPALKSDAQRQGLELNALTGEELTERVTELGNTPQTIISKTQVYTEGAN